ncbi:MAG: ATP-binding protein [Lachnospiraceae bacterium]|nr:ATP-binding protein [Lachnospiraceae bacterium]
MALKNSQYDMIMRDYEQKQLHSRDILNSHFEELYARIPELQSLDDSISFLSVQQAKKILNGDVTALASLKEELAVLRNNKEQLMQSHGFSADYLSPVYVCMDCQDTGYINNRKCHCFKKAIIELLYSQSNLKDILKKENFSTFSLSYYSENHIDPKSGRTSLNNMKNALAVCKDFVHSFETDFHNLFFYGDTGVGKTFLSNCIAKELIDSSHSVIYFTSFELFDIFAKSKFEKNQDAEAMYDYIFDCDLLIIDDLGTELTNSFVTSQLFSCVNERLLRRKSTIISTNISLEMLREIYSERTFSRITSNYTMLKLTGDDIRIKKKLMNMEDK